MATAGSINAYDFNRISSHFEMTFETGVGFQGLNTDIYFNIDTHYPAGVLLTLNGVEISSPDATTEFNVQCSRDGDSNPNGFSTQPMKASNSHLLIAYMGAEVKVAVSLSITRCGVSGACTCRRH
jgi:hypothetical protein